MWTIKHADLACKEMLSKMSLLDRLIAKEGPLNECEEVLKKKLIDELLDVRDCTLGHKHVYVFVVQIVSGRVTERCHRGRLYL
ncbi:hypothetical protein DY000_02003932 [Brassica cretica]|uniref:Uncharacterized protein n=1 Tax=Brassica cretica TaxID=69181 RepID=A0ABQ7CEE8_BRACR|nr:hypothetical protein DY000_02003932 [Brassica cretica]